jgi:hypothetical protein
MFQSSPKGLRAWLVRAVEAFGAAPLADAYLDSRPAYLDSRPAHLDSPPWAAHPHRRPLRWQHERRGGAVPAAPAYCLCPVSSAHVGRQPARAADTTLS